MELEKPAPYPHLFSIPKALRAFMFLPWLFQDYAWNNLFSSILSIFQGPTQRPPPPWSFPVSFWMAAIYHCFKFLIKLWLLIIKKDKRKNNTWLCTRHYPMLYNLTWPSHNPIITDAIEKSPLRVYILSKWWSETETNGLAAKLQSPSTQKCA